MQPDRWLPLTEYALRSGMSISTLRRKIKANSIDFRMEDGRYLIRSDILEDHPGVNTGFTSSDAPIKVPEAPKEAASVVPAPALSNSEAASAFAVPPKESALRSELEKIQNELRYTREESQLRWRALEARVAGLAKKVELFSEQIAEVKMLVKIFEEKLDERF